MATQNIIDLSTGKINPIYLPAIPATIPTLNEVLTVGNQTGGILIDAQGGNVICDAMKCISIEAATAPLFNTIAVDADFIVTPFGKLGFEDNALITCNEGIAPKNVIETTNSSGNAIYKVAEGNIQYETSSKLLTVNPISVPPSPFLITQGLTVNGAISAVSGDVNIKGATPSVNYQDSTGTQKATVDYNESQNKLTAFGRNVVLDTDGTGYPRVLLENNVGATVRTDDKPVRLRRYSATGTTLQTDLALNANGQATLTAPVLGDNAVLRLETNGGNNGEIIIDQVNNAMLIKAGTLNLNPANGNVAIVPNVGDIPVLALQSSSGTNLVQIIANDTSSLVDVIAETGYAMNLQTTNNNITFTANGAATSITLSSDNTAASMSLASNTSISAPDINVTASTGNISISSNGSGTQVYLSGDGGNSSVSIDSTVNIATASSGSITLTTPSVLLGGITTYDTPAGVQVNVQADVDNLDQVLTNNAYVPMTWYKRDIVFTIDPAVSLAFQTSDFIWRYSGLYGTTNSESRYCATLKFQIDINISAEDLSDTIVWWVKLFNINTSAPYYSIDFPDERFGFIADRVINPYNGARNQCISFSSTFNLDPGFTGQAIPVDGEVMRIEVYGWGTTSTTTSRAQVSATIRPLRNMV